MIYILLLWLSTMANFSEINWQITRVTTPINYDGLETPMQNTMILIVVDGLLRRFLNDFTKHGLLGHLGHVTNIICISLQNLDTNGLVVFEKSELQFSYVNNLGPRLTNDREYSHTFIYSFSFLHLPAPRSQVAIVAEKSIVFTYSCRKA